MTTYYRILHFGRLQIIIRLDGKWKFHIYRLKTMNQYWVQLGLLEVGVIATWL